MELDKGLIAPQREIAPRHEQVPNLEIRLQL